MTSKASNPASVFVGARAEYPVTLESHHQDQTSTGEGVLAAFSIGANLGDRARALEHAVARLSTLDGYTLAGVSARYETTPVGGPDQPDYLNQVVVLRAAPATAEAAEAADAAEQAEALLRTCHEIEAEMARRRDVRWGPRTLDVDLLAMGSHIQTDADLTVPHPRISERAFVLVPWAEVTPDFLVPGLGSVAALLAELPRSEIDSVRRC